jgi:hypothetical protein
MFFEEIGKILFEWCEFERKMLEKWKKWKKMTN